MDCSGALTWARAWAVRRWGRSTYGTRTRPATSAGGAAGGGYEACGGYEGCGGLDGDGGLDGGGLDGDGGTGASDPGISRPSMVPRWRTSSPTTDSLAVCSPIASVTEPIAERDLGGIGPLTRRDPPRTGSRPGRRHNSGESDRSHVEIPQDRRHDRADGTTRGNPTAHTSRSPKIAELASGDEAIGERADQLDGLLGRVGSGDALSHPRGGEDRRHTGRFEPFAGLAVRRGER